MLHLFTQQATSKKQEIPQEEERRGVSSAFIELVLASQSDKEDSE